MTDREAFVAVWSNGPLLKGDAVVVLSGDGEMRLQFGLKTYAEGAAPLIVLSGGLDNPPYSLSARRMADWMIEHGVHPDRMLLEDVSTNTREQSVNVVRWAVERDWHRLLIVASPHHSFRAGLTFMRAIMDVGKERDIQLVNVAARHAPWFKDDRFDSLAEEFAKIEEYGALGHCATYAEGIEYLRSWEGR